MTQPNQTIQSLLQQIAAKLPADDQHLVTALQDVLKQPQPGAASTAVPELDASTGCYRFDLDPGFYCPKCFENTKQRVPTQRVNRKLRICTQCRASLKPQD